MSGFNSDSPFHTLGGLLTPALQVPVVVTCLVHGSILTHLTHPVNSNQHVNPRHLKQVILVEVIVTLVQPRVHAS